MRLGRPPSPTELAHFREHLVALFRAAAATRPFDPVRGAPELLARLKQENDYRVALATGCWADSARVKMSSAGMRIDDFNGNNFDHGGLGFIRGGTIGTSGDGTPVTRLDVLPPNVRAWGKEFKDFYTRYYTRTMDLNMSSSIGELHSMCSLGSRWRLIDQMTIDSSKTTQTDAIAIKMDT